MGSLKLYKHHDSSFRFDDIGNVIYHGFVNILDGTIGKVVRMAEFKLALFVLTILGVPAGIYAYFLQVNDGFDLIKGIILLSIGAFTGIVLVLRYLIKLASEWKEFRRKYYNKK